MKKFLTVSILIHLLFFGLISFFFSSNKLNKNSNQLSYVVINEVISSTINKQSENKQKDQTKVKNQKLVSSKFVKSNQLKKVVNLKKIIEPDFSVTNSKESKEQIYIHKNQPEKSELAQQLSETKITQTDTKSVLQQSSFELPSYRFSPKPEYPVIAKKRGYEGEIVIDVFVLENGNVGELKLFKASGYKVLDNSAISAVRKWKFIPGKDNGEPISTWVKVPISFKLISG